MRNLRLLFTDPTKLGLVVLLALILAVAALVLFASEVRAYSKAEEIKGVTAAIQWLLKEAPKRRLTRNRFEQRKIARAMVSVGRKRGVCPYLILANAFIESSLRRNVRGVIGEIGMMQVHGLAQKGCNLKSYYGHIDCGAKWLAKSITRCGSTRRGVAAYMSGSCVIRPFSRKEYLVQRRLDLWNWLRKVADASHQGTKPRSWRYRNE